MRNGLGNITIEKLSGLSANQKGTLLVWTCGAFLLLLYYMTNSLEISLFLILLLLSTAFLLIKPYIGLLVIPIYITFQYWFVEETKILSTFFLWGDDMLLLVMTASWFAQKNTKIFTKSYLSLPLLTLLAISVLSGIHNLVPLKNWFLGLRGFFFFALYYYALLNIDLSDKFKKILISVIVFTGFIQLPFIFYQFFSQDLELHKIVQIAKAVLTGADLHLLNLNVDSQYGSFMPGQANNVGYFLLIILILLATRGIYTKRRMDIFLQVPLLFTAYFLTSSRGSFGALLLTIWLLMKIQYLDKKDNLFVKYIIPLLLIVIFHKDILNFFSSIIDWFVASQTSLVAPRLLYYPLTYSLLLGGGVANLLFGFGPGMYSSYVAFKTQTYYSQILLGAFGQIGYGFHAGVDSQYIALWGELGFIGLFACIWLLFRSYKIAKTKLCETNMETRYLASGFMAALLVFIIGGFFSNVWEVSHVAFYFWALLGLTEISAKKDNKNENSADQ